MKARLLLDLLTPCIGHQHIDPYLGRVSKRHDKKYLGSRKALVTNLGQLVVIIRVCGSSFGEFFIVLKDALTSLGNVAHGMHGTNLAKQVMVLNRDARVPKVRVRAYALQKIRLHAGQGMFGFKGSPHTGVRTRDRTFLKRAFRSRDDGAAQHANVLRLLPSRIIRIHFREVALKCIGTVLVVILSHQHRRHGLIRLRLGRRFRSFVARRGSSRRH